MSPGTLQVLQNVWWTGRPWVSVHEKEKYGIYAGKKGAQYGYGVYWAARQAKALGLKEMSVMEFGVGTGRGLMTLENLAREIGDAFGVAIAVYGFDLGEGLPEPQGYKDLPYIWKGGFYKMDVRALRSKLTSAELVLGDVKHTVPEFLKRERIEPIGFVAIDLDLYSATKAAFELFRSGRHDIYLPRPYVLLEDTTSQDLEIHCDYVGELAAAREFNEENDMRKICKVEHIRYVRKRPATWNEKVFVCHMFDHPQYCTYIGSTGEAEGDTAYRQKNVLLS